MKSFEIPGNYKIFKLLWIVQKNQGNSKLQQLLLVFHKIGGNSQIPKFWELCQKIWNLQSPNLLGIVPKFIEIPKRWGTISKFHAITQFEKNGNCSKLPENHNFKTSEKLCKRYMKFKNSKLLMNHSRIYGNSDFLYENCVFLTCFYWF